MGVGGGQADRVDDKVDDKVNSVDDMVVGDKLEERDTHEDKHDGASEEEEEEQAVELKVDKEEDVKDEEEEKEDKENEGTEDNPGEAELELSRLKELVPSVSVKDNVSQLDVILEAIRYISSLQGKLADKIEAGDVVPVLVNNS